MTLEDVFIGFIEQNNTERVRYFLKHEKIDPSFNFNLPFRTVCSTGNVEIAKLLLKDHRVKPSDVDNNGLAQAIHRKNIELVKLILNDRRTDLSFGNVILLETAYNKFHPKILKLIINHPQIDSICNCYKVIDHAMQYDNLSLLSIVFSEKRIYNHLKENYNNFYQRVTKYQLKIKIDIF